MSYTVGFVGAQTFRDPEIESAGARLQRLRVRGSSSFALSDALDALAQEKPLSEARLAYAREALTRKTLSGTPNEIVAAKAQVELALAEVEQLDALKSAYTESRETRLKQEVEATNRLTALAADAEKKVNRFNSWRQTAYQKHAAEIVAGIKLEDDANQAIRNLKGEMESWRGLAIPDPGATDRADEYKHFRNAIRLPGHHYPPVVNIGPYAR